MARLWEWDRPASVREVLEDLNDERPLAYTTIMTVMDNLHRKGMLSRGLEGRAFFYLPVHTKAEHSAELIAAALSTDEDRTSALLRFFDQLTPQEVSRLRAALDTRKQKTQ